jgi:hypothetical protein
LCWGQRECGLNVLAEGGDKWGGHCGKCLL